MKLKKRMYATVCICQIVITTTIAQTWNPTPIPINHQVYEWAKSEGGISDDVGYALTADSLGNSYITGLFSETVDFDPGTGNYNLTAVGTCDIFISKFDTSGAFVWAKQVGGTSCDSGHAIILDDFDNLYVTGSFFDTADFDPGPGVHNLTSAGNYDIFILKLDTNGNFVWAKNMGGTEADMGFSIALDALGNIITTGYYTDTADFDPGAGVQNLTAVGERDIFISKLDSSGNFMGIKGVGGLESDEGNSIAIDTSGNIIVTGYFKDTVDFNPGAGTQNLISAGNKDAFVLKLNSLGNFLGVKRIGGVGEDVGNSLVLDSQNNICTTGYFEETVDFNPNFGTHNLTSAGGLDIFVSKLTNSGVFLGAVIMGADGSDKGNCVTVDTSDNMYVTGSFRQTVDFDPSSEVYELVSNGHEDIFISKLTSSGGFSWAYGMGNNGGDVGYGIAVNSAKNVYTTGSFVNTVDFDPGTNVDNLTSNGLFDVFLQKLGDTLTPQPPYGTLSVLSLYPNPTQKNLTVDFNQFHKSVTINVKGFDGELLSTQNYRNKEKIDFSLSGDPGLYFVELLFDGDQRTVLKVVKQ